MAKIITLPTFEYNLLLNQEEAEVLYVILALIEGEQTSRRRVADSIGLALSGHKELNMSRMDIRLESKILFLTPEEAEKASFYPND